MLEHVGLVAMLAPCWHMFEAIPRADVRREVQWAAAAGVLLFCVTSYLIPRLSVFTLRAGLKGRDLCKKGSPGGDIDIPESLGIVVGVLFLAFIICAQMLYSKTTEQLLTYNSALLSICFMLLLGFMDDVVDLPWRYKLILPAVATLPLLFTYDGVTWVKLPLFAGDWLVSDASPSGLTALGALLEHCWIEVDKGASGILIRLGLLYYVFMGLLAVFCTNAINILAGVNGLEAGQSLVIAMAILFINLFELSSGAELGHPHVFSIVLIIPFIAATLALLRFNWYPSSVFVGDTYCYFAGMTFAVVGILGHFSKTLLLFFIPQIVNFLYSVPQLFKFVPCPRHRLPFYDPETRCLKPSTYSHNGKDYPNRTLINWTLVKFGPMPERTLTLVLLGYQVLSCAVALYLRLKLASWWYN